MPGLVVGVDGERPGEQVGGVLPFPPVGVGRTGWAGLPG